MPRTPLIDLTDVVYTPDGTPVLAGISLQSDARRIGIVGRNGSGKTSLARIMAGLIAPDSGQVAIGGVDVAQDRKEAIAVVGILFQNPDHQIIFPTVEEELAFGLTQMGQSATTAANGVAQILARFDRSHWAKAAIHQLSQGQRQLVCLMSVLAMAPRVILLDEPFAGLDLPTVQQLERVLAGLDQTLVQITHDPRSIAGYDQVLWIDDGRIVASGPPHEVLPGFEARMAEIGEGDDLTHIPR